MRPRTMIIFSVAKLKKITVKDKPPPFAEPFARNLKLKKFLRTITKEET